MAPGFTDTYWYATAPESPPARRLTQDLTADVAIIGGGFTGLSAALHLAQTGRAVVLIEAQALGWGASGRNAGYVVPNFAMVTPNKVVARLGEAQGERLNALIGGAADAVFELIRQRGIDCETRQDGWIQPAHAAAMLPVLRARYEQWAARGRPVEWLDADAVAARTGCNAFAGGWLDRSAGTIHPLKFVRGLASAAQRAGAAILSQTRAERFEPHGDRWRISTAGGVIECRRVLLCTHAHVGDLLPALARSFIPLTVHQIATAPIPSPDRERLLPGGVCVTDARTHPFSARWTSDHRLISGGMAMMQWGARRRLARTISRRLADTLDLPAPPAVDYIWSGTVAIAPDFLPRLHQPAPGLIVGIGCNGRGIALSIALGRVMADMALGSAHDTLPIPVTPIRPMKAHGLTRHAPKFAIPYGIWRDWQTARR